MQKREESVDQGLYYEREKIDLESKVGECLQFTDKKKKKSTLCTEYSKPSFNKGFKIWSCPCILFVINSVYHITKQYLKIYHILFVL